MKKTRITIVILLVFCMDFNAFSQSDRLVLINTSIWKPENINVNGDNNVVFYGDNITLNRVEVPSEALKKIEDQYKQKLKTIRQKAKKQKKIIQQINREIQELQSNTRTAIISAHELHKNFLNIDFEKSSDQYKKAYELFKQGAFDQVQILLDDIRLEEQDRKNADNRKLKANLHAVKFEFTQARTNFEIAIRIFENFQNVFDYGYFLMIQSDYRRADSILATSLKLSETDIQKAVVLTNIGLMARRQNQLNKAIEKYLESVPYYEKALRKEPVYIGQVGTVLNNVGSLTLDMGLLKDAQIALESAIAIRRELYSIDPGAYAGELVTTIMNLGLLHQKKSDVDTAFSYFNEAITLNRTRLANENWKAKSDLAKNLDYLGGLYWDSGNMSSAEAAYRESLALFSELSTINPENYEIEKIRVLINLGYFFIEFEAPKKGIEHLILAQNTLLENQFTTDSIVQEYLGTVTHNIGLGYERLKDPKNALIYYKKAQDTRGNSLNKTNIESYANYAQTMNCIANILTDQEDWDNALIAYLDALEKRSIAYQVSNDVYGLDYTETMINLALFYYTRHLKLHQAEDQENTQKLIDKSLSILDKLPHSLRKEEHMALLQTLKNATNK